MNICITGSSRGLGRALADHLSQNGHEVRGLARTNQATEPATWKQVIGTIADEASLKAWHDSMRAENFQPDVVVLNASIMPNDMQSTSLDTAASKQTIDTNLTGTLQTIATFLPEMIARSKGTFVLIASTAAIRPSQKSASYSAAKAGMMMAMRSLQSRYGSQGICFKTVILGPIATDMWEGKRTGLVPSVDQAANIIAKFALTDRKTLWYPFLSTTLLRLSTWLPDSVFAFVSEKLMK